ncbi:hypothetical protein AB0M34_21335 [Nocardia sp. NPDC050193]
MWIVEPGGLAVPARFCCISAEQSDELCSLGQSAACDVALAAYRLQDLDGLDTVEANLRLGQPVDRRTYSGAAAILLDLGLPRIRLLTNNPAKRAGLTEAGIEIDEVLGLEIAPNADNLAYLASKRDRLGHNISASAAVAAL